MESKKPEKRELTERQRALISALFGPAEGNWREAMRLAGYAETTTVAEVMEPIKDEVLSQSQSYLASLQPKAVSKMGAMLDNPSMGGAPNLFKVVESILNRTGLSDKRGDEATVKVPAGGLFILPAKEVQEFKRVHNSDELESEELGTASSQGD